LIDTNEQLQARLRALRGEFDQSFARPGTDFLLIRVAGEPHALRLAEVAALEADRAITPVPSEARALLGVAGLRGALVAVFDLAQLLGLPAPSPAGKSPPSGRRWLALVKGTQVAMAFGEFEGQRRLGADALATALEAGQQGELIRTAGTARPLVQLATLAARCEPSLRPVSGEESR
jgi:chemotaxis signal transduction protein